MLGRGARRTLAFAALAAAGSLVSRAADLSAGEEAFGCRHGAVLLPEDAGQNRVYDGIRKGLEFAQLERVCREETADEPAAFEALVARYRGKPAPTPLLFAIGHRAITRLLAAGFEGPGVLVTTELTAGNEPLVPEPARGARVAR